MAVERDYLLRHLQAFAQALAEAIGLRHQGKILEALYLLDDLIHTDREARELVDLPLDEFIQRIDFMQDFDPNKWALIAEALQEKGTLLELSDRWEPARDYKIKALHLALEVLLSDPETFRAGARSIVDLAQANVRLQPLPASTWGLLQEYRGSEN